MENQEKTYYVGLDIGTNSIGYAVTDANYRLVKYQQHPAWGVHLFDEAKQASERRAFRAARRRLDRRQQRIQLLRELFATTIGAVDQHFYHRIDASSMKKTPDELPYAIFADPDYTDRHYYRQYPTIHHLIAELIDSNTPHDVRLVYLACAWLLAHRGHFFSDVTKENIDDITSFSKVYGNLVSFLEDHRSAFSWKDREISSDHIGKILKSSSAKKAKHKELVEYLQVKKENVDSSGELSFNENEFLSLICGCNVKAAKLFPQGNYTDTKEDIILDADDDAIAGMLAELEEDDAALVLHAKNVFDWAVLADIMGDSKNLSSAKVRIYEKHKEDLKKLKHIVRTYLKEDVYYEVFRAEGKNNYVAYCGKGKQKIVQREDFYKFLKSKLKEIHANCMSTEDNAALSRINEDIDSETFLPKQVVSDNRTIPYQLYWNELNKLLTKASVYLPFLNERDTDNLSVREKILSIMEFRIPYFVGPLDNSAHRKFAWFKRKAEGRILPWNFDKKVDLDASEEEFIKRMTNHCTYLPKEPVLPKHSLLYQKFEVLNQLNTLRVNGKPLPVECKQELYSLFSKHKKVTKTTILAFMKSNNWFPNIDIDINTITGIDDTITATLSSWKLFKPLFDAKKLTEDDAEGIIKKRSYMEDKQRFCAFLKKEYSLLAPEDIRKIASGNLQGFGRLSKRFLTEPLFIPQIGDKRSIINMMWEDNLNLQQLMSESYPFAEMVRKARREYYSNASESLIDQLDKMYISNAVKRPIIRSMTIVDEISRTMGGAPAKIFVEMARDVTGENKGKRTVSRLDQLKKLYSEIADDDLRYLNRELEKYDESALQKDTLYLYFMQLGRDMYTGEAITDLSLYNKEHIYPQSKVKDDSILNNIVLVKSEINGAKQDVYPIAASIREKMWPFWKSLLDKKLITEEKFLRLIRSTPFTDDEQWGFINRQLVETRQSTKVITELLKERYPESEIVYVKAGLVSDFRHAFGIVKSRVVNDLHHGKDAYLNVVVGNVWHEYFTRRWFDGCNGQYNIRTEAVFGGIRKNQEGVIWRGAEDVALVKNVMKRNYLHLTSYSYCQHGGLFDQNPLPAKEGLIPLKKGKPSILYGGYNKSTASFFVFTITEDLEAKKPKKELTLVPVDLMIASKFLSDESFAIDYVRHFIDPKCKCKEIAVHFPLGLKPVKIKSVFEVDGGLRFRLNGKGNNGKILLISLFSPLLVDSSMEEYIKHLESFCEKQAKNNNIRYSAVYDKFSAEANVELYDMLLSKLRTGLFAKRPNNLSKCLENGRSRFVALKPEQQAKILLDIIRSLGTESAQPIDLHDINGANKAGVTTLNSNLSNWKYKNGIGFTTARLVYADSSGLHETKSVNLLDLI